MNNTSYLYQSQVELYDSDRKLEEVIPYRFGFRKIEIKDNQKHTPPTVQELENATHQEELALARRTVVCIMGAVHGVGEIDSWGSDVEEKYHISGEKDIQFSFCITKP